MAERITVEEAVATAEFRSAMIRRFLRRSELAAEECGLTPRRYLLLLMVKGARGGTERSTVGELVERLQLAQSTVTELLNRSVEAGLIVREVSSADRRVVTLTLTPEGERRLACAFIRSSAERRALRDALGGLPHSAY